MPYIGPVPSVAFNPVHINGECIRIDGAVRLAPR
jgi:hypothetical protein